jgi:hypothetical protein
VVDQGAIIAEPRHARRSNHEVRLLDNPHLAISTQQMDDVDRCTSTPAEARAHIRYNLQTHTLQPMLRKVRELPRLNLTFPREWAP